MAGRRLYPKRNPDSFTLIIRLWIMKLSVYSKATKSRTFTQSLNFSGTNNPLPSRWRSAFNYSQSFQNLFQRVTTFQKKLNKLKLTRRNFPGPHSLESLHLMVIKVTEFSYSKKWKICCGDHSPKFLFKSISLVHIC